MVTLLNWGCIISSTILGHPTGCKSQNPLNCFKLNLQNQNHSPHFTNEHPPHSNPIVKLETEDDDVRDYNDDSFDMFGAGDYGPDAGTGDFVPLKFEDKEYDQDQGDRVEDFEDVSIDPKVSHFIRFNDLSCHCPAENSDDWIMK